MLWKSKFRHLIKFVTVVAVFFQIANVSTLATATNPIGLKVTKVVVGGKDQPTQRLSASSWTYNGDLTRDDAIKYQWSGIDLNLKYKTTPARGGGYLKIYLGTVSEDNFLLEHGLDVYPLTISSIADKLSPGSNTLQFVYLNSVSKTPTAPVSFRFNFADKSANPSLKVLSPEPGSVFIQEEPQDISLELRNFKLSNTVTNQEGFGKLNVYYNEVKNENFIGRISNGSEQENGTFLVKFSSSDLDFSRVPDSDKTKLIFALTDVGENLLQYRTSLEIKSNFNNQLDTGLPRISIIEPKKNRSDIGVSGDTKFILKVDNFTILQDATVNTETEVKANEGYIHISVASQDRSEPLQPRWTKTDFTLDEIKFFSEQESRQTIKVKLVNANFEDLVPEVSDTIEVFYEPSVENTDELQVTENNTWRIIIITLTVILIVGGISILITKG